MNNHLLTDLLEVFNKARSDVPIYRELYKGIKDIRSLVEFAQLPVLTKSLLTTGHLERSLSVTTKLCMTRTYLDDPRTADYVPRLLSYEDVLDEYAVLDSLMKPITDEKHRTHTLMLIGDELHAYANAELGNQLAYYELPLMAFIASSQNEDKLAAHLKWFRPSVVFLDAYCGDFVLDSVEFLFTFNRRLSNKREQDHPQSVTRFDILRDSFVGPLAIKRDPESFYRFDPELFYFENSADGMLLVTSLTSRLQPLIRYKLPFRGFTSTEETVVVYSAS